LLAAATLSRGREGRLVAAIKKAGLGKVVARGWARVEKAGFMKNKNAFLFLLAVGAVLVVTVAVGAWLIWEQGRAELPAVLRERRVEEKAKAEEDVVTQRELDMFQQSLKPEGFLDLAISRFQLRMGRYPDALEELLYKPEVLKAEEKWDGPYVRNERILTDPWGRPVMYVAPGNHNVQSYDIWSTGADGVSGTSDDIGNW
jgi:general secretion pathway protein G